MRFFRCSMVFLLLFSASSENSSFAASVPEVIQFSVSGGTKFYSNQEPVFILFPSKTNAKVGSLNFALKSKSEPQPKVSVVSPNNAGFNLPLNLLKNGNINDVYSYTVPLDLISALSDGEYDWQISESDITLATPTAFPNSLPNFRVISTFEGCQNFYAESITAINSDLKSLYDQISTLSKEHPDDQTLSLFLLNHVWSIPEPSKPSVTLGFDDCVSKLGAGGGAYQQLRMDSRDLLDAEASKYSNTNQGTSSQNQSSTSSATSRSFLISLQFGPNSPILTSQNSILLKKAAENLVDLEKGLKFTFIDYIYSTKGITNESKKISRQRVNSVLSLLAQQGVRVALSQTSISTKLSNGKPSFVIKVSY